MITSDYSTARAIAFKANNSHTEEFRFWKRPTVTARLNNLTKFFKILYISRMAIREI